MKILDILKICSMNLLYYFAVMMCMLWTCSISYNYICALWKIWIRYCYSRTAVNLLMLAALTEHSPPRCRFFCY